MAAARRTIEAVAAALAAAHREEDPSLTVYLALAKDATAAKLANEVRLVEVSDTVGTTGEVLPFRFSARPDLGVPYPSVIVLLSRDDWQKVKRRRLALPEGWGTPDDLKKIA